MRLSKKCLIIVLVICIITAGCTKKNNINNIYIDQKEWLENTLAFIDARKNKINNNTIMYGDYSTQYSNLYDTYWLMNLNCELNLGLFKDEKYQRQILTDVENFLNQNKYYLASSNDDRLLYDTLLAIKLQKLLNMKPHNDGIKQWAIKLIDPDQIENLYKSEWSIEILNIMDSQISPKSLEKFNQIFTNDQFFNSDKYNYSVIKILSMCEVPFESFPKKTQELRKQQLLKQINSLNKLDSFSNEWLLDSILNIQIAANYMKIDTELSPLIEDYIKHLATDKETWTIKGFPNTQVAYKVWLICKEFGLVDYYNLDQAKYFIRGHRVPGGAESAFKTNPNFKSTYRASKIFEYLNKNTNILVPVEKIKDINSWEELYYAILLLRNDEKYRRMLILQYNKLPKIKVISKQTINSVYYQSLSASLLNIDPPHLNVLSKNIISFLKDINNLNIRELNALVTLAQEFDLKLNYKSIVDEFKYYQTPKGYRWDRTFDEGDIMSTLYGVELAKRLGISIDKKGIQELIKISQNPFGGATEGRNNYRSIASTFSWFELKRIIEEAEHLR